MSALGNDGDNTNAFRSDKGRADMKHAIGTLAVVALGVAASPTQASTRGQPSASHEQRTSRAVVGDGEVVIHEPARPGNVWKSFAGTCDGDRYEISIYTGRSLVDAIRLLQVNGEELRRSALRAIISAPAVQGRVIDAKISECGKGAAKVRFMIPATQERWELHSYDLWIHANGRVEFIGEQ